MKLYVVLIILFCLTACSDPTPLVYEIETERGSVEFSFEQGETQFTVSANCNWEIMDIPEWLAVNPAYGGKGKTKVKLTCQPNPAEGTRKVNLKIVSDEKNMELTVLQSPKGVLQFYDRDTILYTLPTTFLLPLKSNLDYHFILPEDCNWLKIHKAYDNRILLNIEAMNEKDFRSTSLIIKADNYQLCDTFVILQMTKEYHIREILTKLYNSLNGPGWSRQRNWLSDKPIGVWEGITFMNGELRIVLTDNNLEGQLPDEIYDLPDLVGLELGWNRIEGVLKPAIRKWNKLRYLNLVTNLLSGNIPDELWTLPELQSLLLGRCPFEPVTVNFSGLYKIRWLSFGKMQLTEGLSEEMGKWKELEHLEIADCSMMGFLPEALFTDRLKYLSLINNKIKGNIPPEIKNAKNLEYLYLTNNELTGQIPEEMGELLLLKELMLSDNYLTGNIPQSVLNLPNWHLFQLPLILPQKNGWLTTEIK